MNYTSKTEKVNTGFTVLYKNIEPKKFEFNPKDNLELFENKGSDATQDQATSLRMLEIDFLTSQDET